jgi:drug/metabolite transporter (DMT)-like permease
VLAVVLALVSALGFGFSDYTAGLATRVSGVLKVTIAAQLVSLAGSLVVVPWVSPYRLPAAAAAWGAVAGVAGVAGAVMLYLGFRYAMFSVASTLSAVGAATLSVLAGLLYGERPSVLALTGIALALPAIAAVSASPGAASTYPGSAGSQARRSAAGRHLAGVGYGLVSGACFALYFVGLNRAGSGSGLWPVLVGEAVSLPLLAVVAALAGQFGLPARGSRALCVATGAMGAAGTMLYFIATHRGLLAVTAVITSLYPAVTIGLARARLGERLGAVRLAGFVLAGASVALIAVSSAS